MPVEGGQKKGEFYDPSKELLSSIRIKLLYEKMKKCGFISGNGW